jgi:hypothetical protein
MGVWRASIAPDRSSSETVHILHIYELMRMNAKPHHNLVCRRFRCMARLVLTLKTNQTMTSPGITLDDQAALFRYGTACSNWRGF